MNKRRVVKGGLARISRRERTEKAQPASGIIRPDTGALRLPSDLSDEENQNSVLPNRVVLTITILALLFIAIITWFVAHMPAKPG